jgi:hypothetical protein
LFETDGVDMLVKETFEWVTNMGGKTKLLTEWSSNTTTVSPIQNDLNTPPKRASSLLGSSRTYNRLIPISSLRRKAKIDINVGNHVRDGMGCRRNWDLERMFLRKR